MSELKEAKQPEPSRVSLGLTQKVAIENAGFGDSVTVFISVSDNVKPGEKVSEAIDRVYKLVESKTIEKVAEATGK